MLESRGSVVSLASRGVEIVWNLGLYWSTLVYDFLVGRDEEVVPFRARQLRNLLCNLGPSFIKAGQVCMLGTFLFIVKALTGFSNVPLRPRFLQIDLISFAKTT